MAAAALGLWSCQSELEKVTLVDPSQVVAPVLHELPEEITITADNMSEEVVFGWEKADFGQKVQNVYSIYASTEDSGSLVTLYSNISGLSQATTFEKFNQLVTTKKEKGGLGLPLEEALKKACDHTAHTISVTLENPSKPWYGVDFEATMKELV